MWISLAASAGKVALIDVALALYIPEPNITHRPLYMYMGTYITIIYSELNM